METISIQAGQLVQLGATQANENKYLSYLNDACSKYNINTPLRLAAFCAQLFVESGSLSITQENLNYSANRLLAVFPTHFNGIVDANNYAGNPVAIGNRVYANRMGNGSESSGDGYNFRGQGLIQLTGKSNYSSCSSGIGVNLVSNPSLLSTPQYAALSAAWFWNSKSLNDYADASDFTSITKRINGGLNGADERNAFYQKALIIFGAATQQSVPPTVPPTMVPVPANTGGVGTKKQVPPTTPQSQSLLAAVIQFILGTLFKKPDQGM